MSASTRKPRQRPARPLEPMTPEHFCCAVGLLALQLKAGLLLEQCPPGALPDDVAAFLRDCAQPFTTPKESSP